MFNCMKTTLAEVQGEGPRGGVGGARAGGAGGRECPAEGMVSFVRGVLGFPSTETCFSFHRQS